MVLDWTAEEKTLLNMEKIIAAVWRMNRQQMYAYYRRMQKKQPKILPGQIGTVSAVQKTDVFMEENSWAKTETVSRTENLKDADQPIKKAKIQNKPQIKNHLEKLAQYREMSEAYPQLYGWLQIPETQIDLPVMRAEGDRDFYLHYDFTGAESAEGALFADAESSIYPQDDNTVIYGHNMKNGHIFGTLKMYLDQEFFQTHREVRFDTFYENGVYEAVAVLKTRILNENENGFRYHQFFQYKNKEEFQECMDFVEENRLFETGSALQYGDDILMLSTCEYSQENGRLVVVARKTGSAHITAYILRGGSAWNGSGLTLSFLKTR